MRDKHMVKIQIDKNEAINALLKQRLPKRWKEANLKNAQKYRQLAFAIHPDRVRHRTGNATRAFQELQRLKNLADRPQKTNLLHAVPKALLVMTFLGLFIQIVYLFQKK